MIAKVAIPISIASNNEIFDYLVPENIRQDIRVGCRVFVPLRNSVVLGYVTGFKKKSSCKKKLKLLYKNLDETPILDEKIFILAYKIRSEYFCSLGEAISSILPIGLKRPVKNNKACDGEVVKRDIPYLPLTEQESELLNLPQQKERFIAIMDLSGEKRWTAYSALIKETLNLKKSVLFLVPGYHKIESSINRLDLKVRPYLFSSFLNSKESLNNWLSVKKAEFSFVIGTRSAVFAPVNKLGLVIIEDGGHFAYLQEQAPHYRADEIAFWRAGIDGARVVLGSCALSLDHYFLTKVVKAPFLKERSAYLKFASEKPWPLVKIVDMRHDARYTSREKVLSKVFEYRIAENIQKKEKILIFVNKKGFSTFLYCKKCEKIQSCPRCSSSLTYFFKEKVVCCPICRYRVDSFDLCQECKSSYIKFLGCGCEKVESEIRRLFPTAKTAFLSKQVEDSGDCDIAFATQQLFEDFSCLQRNFDSIYVISCDEMLGYADFRSTEKAFLKLLRLGRMAEKQLFLQTKIPSHYIFEFLKKFDVEGFYERELSLRKELKLPPYKRLGLLRVRAKMEETARLAAMEIYNELACAVNKKSGFYFFEPAPCSPLKVRDNYRYQILIKHDRLDKIKKKLASVLKQRRKGVILTIEPDVV